MLGFGVGISNCGIRGGVSDAPDFSGSAAKALLAGESQGLAFDFTDSSAYIIDTGTPANNYDSTGIVAGGELVGPSGKLTYTSPSNKLTLQADGFLKYQAHNLCLQSENFTTSWPNTGSTDVENATTAPDGTITADQIIETAVTSGHGVQQAITLVVGASYRIAVRVKKGPTSRSHFAIGTLNAGTGYSYFNLDAVAVGTKLGGHISSGITNLGDGWSLCYIDIVPTAASVTVFLIPASDDSVPSYAGDVAYSFYLWGAHVYRTPANTDYIRTTTAAKYALPIEYDTSGNCLGLLVEEQRTNLLLYNTQFDNAAWTETNIATISAGSVVAPNGLAEAETLTASAGAAVHGVQNTAALTISTGNYTWSAYVKAGTHSYINIQINIGSEQFISAVFDLSGGGSAATETDVGITTGSIESTFQESVGNGWYRIGIVGALTTSSACTVRFSFAEAATGNTFSTFGSISWTAAGTETFSIWGAQVEAGSFPTSPVVTYGAAATRNADNISIATSAFPHSDATQSVYFAYTPNFSSDAGVRNVASLNNGGNTEIIYLLHDDSTGKNKFTITDGGVAQCDIVNTASPPVAGTEQKIALSYAANDVAACVNGGTVQTDVSATMPTVTQLNIGARYSATQHIGSGYISQISVVPRRKTDVELQAETA